VFGKKICIELCNSVNCVVWHGCHCLPLSLPVACFRPDWKNLALALAHSSVHGNTTSVWSQHAWQCEPVDGGGGGLEGIFDECFDRWRSLFFREVWRHWGWAKDFTPLLPPPLFTPNCLVNPCALKEESLTHPSNSRAQSRNSLIADLFLVKEQAGHRQSNWLLIPPGNVKLQGKTLLSVLRQTHAQCTCGINWAQSACCCSAPEWASCGSSSWGGEQLFFFFFVCSAE